MYVFIDGTIKYFEQLEQCDSLIRLLRFFFYHYYSAIFDQKKNPPSSSFSSSPSPTSRTLYSLSVYTNSFRSLYSRIRSSRIFPKFSPFFFFFNSVHNSVSYGSVLRLRLHNSRLGIYDSYSFFWWNATKVHHTTLSRNMNNETRPLKIGILQMVFF